MHNTAQKELSCDIKVLKRRYDQSHDAKKRLFLTKDGLFSENSTLLLPIEKDGAGGHFLPFDRMGGRLVALLSVAMGRLIPADMMRFWQPINEALAKNDFGSAAIMCNWMCPWPVGTHLSPSAVAKMAQAEREIDEGLSPWLLLTRLNLPTAVPNATHVVSWPNAWDADMSVKSTQPLEKYNDLHYPAGAPDHQGGQFAPKNGGYPTLEPVAYNGYYHDECVAQLAEHFRAQGAIVQQSVPITSLDGRTTAIADLIVQDPKTGDIYIVEVKTGDNPTYTPSQMRNYPLAMIGGHVYSNSYKIRAFGFAPGEKLPPIRVDTVYYDDQGKPHLRQERPNFAP